MVVAKTGRWWNKEYIKRNEILLQYKVNVNYTLNWILRKHYKNVCYYSPLPRRYIPVEGYLFPVAMFDEELTFV